MAEISFYHLQKQGVEEALPKLLEVITSRGMKSLVRGPEVVLKKLDEALWTYTAGSFLPHGITGDKVFVGHDVNQPIILSPEIDGNPNNANVLMVLEAESLTNLDGFDRVCLMFDGRDPDATTAAREKWKALKNAGENLTYWQQSDAGKWEKKV
jgi:DNA polymerase-3 subunit chi